MIEGKERKKGRRKGTGKGKGEEGKILEVEEGREGGGGISEVKDKEERKETCGIREKKMFDREEGGVRMKGNGERKGSEGRRGEGG